jgi:hypothetical protein
MIQIIAMTLPDSRGLVPRIDPLRRPNAVGAPDRVDPRIASAGDVRASWYQIFSLTRIAVRQPSLMTADSRR